MTTILQYLECLECYLLIEFSIKQVFKQFLILSNC